ncbi:MAG: hypothetical protein OCU18_01545 [Candidatus Syntrophoarchaeum sp.]|nr:hypothetical protein [Candidatus Syntrophoarchaeum sp.]
MHVHDFKRGVENAGKLPDQSPISDKAKPRYAISSPDAMPRVFLHTGLRNTWIKYYEEIIELVSKMGMDDGIGVSAEVV